MSASFTVLSSGSAGNAALVQANGFGLLVDCGLAARQLAHRLAARGMSWRNVNAVALTHTHGDHWTASTIKALVAHQIVLYCHTDHWPALEQCDSFAKLAAAGLVRPMISGEWLTVCRHIRLKPLQVSHDSEPTLAFRIEGDNGLFGASWSIGYAADLGQWCNSVVTLLANSDLLAIEFNHDERMQQNSGRPRFLIDRVLGPLGHLSNRQAASLLMAVQDASRQLAPCGLVALHRSQQCNTLELVEFHARQALRPTDSPLHVADQYEPLETIALGPTVVSSRTWPGRRMRRTATAGFFDS